MAVGRRLIAVTWTLPPVVLPRSLQVARALKALRKRGWHSTVIRPPLAAITGATLDEELAAHYRGEYEVVDVEFREQVEPSSWPIRKWREHRPVESVDDANWILRASAAVLARLRRNSVLVTFAQPWIDHRVGLAVKRWWPRTPWLAHFSDPWVDSPYYSELAAQNPGLMQQWREQERRIVETADVLVFVTRQTADLVMKKYDPALAAKVRVVPHGIDKDLRDRIRPGERKADRVSIVYTGNIYEGMREPVGLLTALRNLKNKNGVSSPIAVDFYGYAPQSIRSVTNELGLDDDVRYHGPVPFMESLRVSAAADVLLLLDADTAVNVFLPSKVVDYLMMRKPILGLTPLQGATAALLREARHAVIAPSDTGGIEKFLEELVAAHQAGRPIADHDAGFADRYDMDHVIGGFEDALDAAMARRRP